MVKRSKRQKERDISRAQRRNNGTSEENKWSRKDMSSTAEAKDGKFTRKLKKREETKGFTVEANKKLERIRAIECKKMVKEYHRTCKFLTDLLKSLTIPLKPKFLALTQMTLLLGTLHYKEQRGEILKVAKRIHKITSTLDAAKLEKVFINEKENGNLKIRRINIKEKLLRLEELKMKIKQYFKNIRHILKTSSKAYRPLFPRNGVKRSLVGSTVTSKHLRYTAASMDMPTKGIGNEEKAKIVNNMSSAKSEMDATQDVRDDFFISANDGETMEAMLESSLKTNPFQNAPKWVFKKKKSVPLEELKSYTTSSKTLAPSTDANTASHSAKKFKSDASAFALNSAAPKKMLCNTTTHAAIKESSSLLPVRSAKRALKDNVEVVNDTFPYALTGSHVVFNEDSE